MKINKKILLTVLFMFVLSNTGLPVVLHFCGMAKEVKIEACKKCGTSAKNSHAHSKKNNVQSTSISRTGHNCCDSKILASPISEKYISAKMDKSDSGNPELTIIVLNTSDIQKSSILERSNLLLNSPPGQSDNHLYLANSILLI